VLPQAPQKPLVHVVAQLLEEFFGALQHFTSDQTRQRRLVLEVDRVICNLSLVRVLPVLELITSRDSQDIKNQAPQTAHATPA